MKVAFIRMRRIALCSLAVNLILVILLIISLCTRTQVSALNVESPEALEPSTTAAETAIQIIEPTVLHTEVTEDPIICLGEYTITAYCPCVKCCGTWSAQHPSRVGTGYVQRTASGTIPAEGRTIAADTSVLPFGTVVIIDGHEYTVEDCGGAVNGNRIDIFFESHEDALKWGKQTKIIYVKGDN